MAIFCLKVLLYKCLGGIASELMNDTCMCTHGLSLAGQLVVHTRRCCFLFQGFHHRSVNVNVGQYLVCLAG